METRSQLQLRNVPCYFQLATKARSSLLPVTTGDDYWQERDCEGELRPLVSPIKKPGVKTLVLFLLTNKARNMYRTKLLYHMPVSCNKLVVLTSSTFGQPPECIILTNFTLPLGIEISVASCGVLFLCAAEPRGMGSQFHNLVVESGSLARKAALLIRDPHAW